MTEVQPVLPECWTAILANVQRTLAEAEAEALRSAALLEQLPPAPVATGCELQLAALDEPFRRLAACAAGADLLAGEVTAALQASENALRAWLAQVRQPVVTEGDPGV